MNGQQTNFDSIEKHNSSICKRKSYKEKHKKVYKTYIMDVYNDV